MKRLAKVLMWHGIELVRASVKETIWKGGNDQYVVTLEKRGDVWKGRIIKDNVDLGYDVGDNYMGALDRILLEEIREKEGYVAELKEMMSK